MLPRCVFVCFCLFVFLRAGVAAPAEIVICSYNVENYTDQKPAGPDSPYGTRAKSEKEIAALIGIIKAVNPDILGVCEMGSPERFEDFKKRLKAAGLGYVASEYLQAADPDRHLALVSRFPIVARASRGDVPFVLNGQPEKMRRGILDVTIQVNAGYRLRMLGVHLKSKLPAPGGEALIRRHEAEALRKHIDAILAADPTTNLVAYGDFNDTKNEPMFAAITGPKKSPRYMADLWARDSLGDRWTHYWRTADLYSRIDYIFVSPALFREVVTSKSSVYRGDDWLTASDHRPVSATIIPLDKK
jgi:endonuclease/exonuclease/phosphatase family metal-dependent hydrolase